MIVHFWTKAQFGISSAYEPYALGNQVITPAMIEQVDAGAKSLLDLSKYTPVIASGLTLTPGSNNEYTVSGTVSTISSVEWRALPKIDGTLILSGCPSGGSTNSYSMDIFADGTAVAADLGSGSAPFTMGTSNIIRLRFAAGTYSNVKFKIMVCTEADWKVSQKFVPYRPNLDLVERKPYEISITSESVLADLPQGTVTGNLEAMIAGIAAGRWVTVVTVDLNTASGNNKRRMQTIISSSGETATRLYSTGGWGQWSFGHNDATKIFERTTNGNETIANVSPFGSFQLVAWNNTTSGTYSTTIPRVLLTNGMKVAVCEAGGNSIATLQRSGSTTTYTVTVTSGYSVALYGY